ncbi:MAG: protein phosphatase CheZ [Kiloniellaceae bacterium]
MRDQPAIKEFSVERQLRLRRLGARDGVSNADLLRAIEELRREIAALREETQVEAAPLGGDRSGDRESMAARIEIAQMVRMIGQAKLEIATIKHPKAEDDRMLAAASELDAIVVATETSTEDILTAGETIEGIIRKMAGVYHDDDDLVAMTEDIANEIIKIFEACNFQDITGQRINKVVKTIRFIEERILAMIHIWGVEAFAELPLPEQPGVAGEDSLMNGPQLPTQGISQEDINALFD